VASLSEHLGFFDANDSLNAREKEVIASSAIRSRDPVTLKWNGHSE
jgi:hypothetical protein